MNLQLLERESLSTSRIPFSKNSQQSHNISKIMKIITLFKEKKNISPMNGIDQNKNPFFDSQTYSFVSLNFSQKLCTDDKG